jgi:hypothetical protein
MPTQFTPTDDIIGPIAIALGNLIQTQIPGIDTIYPLLPTATWITDGPPDDNSVIIPFGGFKVVDYMSGKAKFKLTYGLRHCFRRNDLNEAIQRAYAYFSAYLKTFLEWSNQDLGGLAIQINILNGGVTQFVQSAGTSVVLVVNLEVLTEIDIPIP